MNRINQVRTAWPNSWHSAFRTIRLSAVLVGWMDRTRAALDAFRPDFVLLWGDDQFENFREDIIPPYCVAAYEKFTFSPRRRQRLG
jgi:hypothetical protein